MSRTSKVLIAIVFCTAVIALTPKRERGTASQAETYRLIHAIGNTERVNAKGLTKVECERQKAELVGVASALGLHNEKTDRGSITCLPESLFTQ